MTQTISWSLARAYFIFGVAVTMFALLIISYRGVTTGILDIKEFIGAGITLSACVYALTHLPNWQRRLQ